MNGPSHFHSYDGQGAPSSVYDQQMGSGYQNGWYGVQENGFSNGVYPMKQSPTPVMGYTPGEGKQPHPVFAFGLGGSFVVVRPSENLYNPQRPTITVLSVSSLVQPDLCLDFNRLESKSKDEINAWVEERAVSSHEEADNRCHQSLPLIWRVLKIANEHNGKLRIGAEGGGPNAAVAQLILKHSASQTLMQLDIVKRLRSLLVCGKTDSAINECYTHQLSCGLLLIVASEQGNTSYVDTVSKLAHQYWSYLQHFCDDSSAEDSVIACWPEYLALAATGRTVHRDFINKLGDSLKTRGELAAAQLCYLLAHDNSECFFSDKIRLIGADHESYPRTYMTPSAFKRTELYEHAKAKENSELLLPCFQAYKYVYANMLAETGRKEEALRYCQDVQKALTTSQGFRADSELFRKSKSLSDRLTKNLESGKSSLAGRVLSNTYNYVKSSLPTSRMTSYKSTSSLNSQAANGFSLTRSASEPDFNTYDDQIAARPPSAGFLRRVGSNVYLKTASLIGMSKQTNQAEWFDGENPNMTGQQSYRPNSIQIPPQVPYNGYQETPITSPGLYTQCATWCKDGGTQLVKSLIPPIPPIWKYSPRKDQPARCAV